MLLLPRDVAALAIPANLGTRMGIEIEGESADGPSAKRHQTDYLDFWWGISRAVRSQTLCPAELRARCLEVIQFMTVASFFATGNRGASFCGLHP